MVNCAITSCAIGTLYYNDGDYDSAFQNFELAAKGFESYYGSFDERTIVLYQKLANLTFEKYKIDREKMLARQRSVPNLLLLGDVQQEEKSNDVCTEDFSEQEKTQAKLLSNAIVRYQDLLKRQEKLYGKESKQTMITCEILGDAFTLQQDYGNAMLCYEKAWTIADEILGSESDKCIELAHKMEEATELDKQRTSKELESVTATTNN